MLTAVQARPKNGAAPTPPPFQYSNSAILNFLGALPPVWFEVVAQRLLSSEVLAGVQAALGDKALSIVVLLRIARGVRTYDVAASEALSYALFDNLEKDTFPDPRVVALRQILFDLLTPFFNFLPDEMIRNRKKFHSSLFEGQFLNHLLSQGRELKMAGLVLWSERQHEELLSVLRGLSLSDSFVQYVEKASRELCNQSRSGLQPKRMGHFKADSFSVVRLAKKENLFDDEMFRNALDELCRQSVEKSGTVDRGNIQRSFFQHPTDVVRVGSFSALDCDRCVDIERESEREANREMIGGVAAYLVVKNKALDEFVKRLVGDQKASHFNKQCLARFGLYANLNELLLLSEERLRALMEEVGQKSDPLSQWMLQYLNEVFKIIVELNDGFFSDVDPVIRQIVLRHCVFPKSDFNLRLVLNKLCKDTAHQDLVLSLGAEFMTLHTAFQHILVNKMLPYGSCTTGEWPTSYQMNIDDNGVSIVSTALYMPASMEEESSLPKYLVETVVSARVVPNSAEYKCKPNELWLDQSRGFLCRYDSATQYALPVGMRLRLPNASEPASPPRSLASLSSFSDSGSSSPSSPASLSS